VPYSIIKEKGEYMKVNFNRLNEIITNKTNRAIEKLEEFKCTTPEYKNTLESILNNLKALKELGQYDIDCPDCIEKVPVETKQPVPNQPTPDAAPQSGSAIGKEWIPFKENKK
jgi:hypothetical protein